jgi:hypothetical protein
MAVLLIKNGKFHTIDFENCSWCSFQCIPKTLVAASTFLGLILQPVLFGYFFIFCLGISLLLSSKLLVQPLPFLFLLSLQEVLVKFSAGLCVHGKQFLLVLFILIKIPNLGIHFTLLHYCLGVAGNTKIKLTFEATIVTNATIPRKTNITICFFISHFIDQLMLEETHHFSGLFLLLFNLLFIWLGPEELIHWSSFFLWLCSLSK